MGPGNSNFGCLRCLQGNQTMLVWFGSSENSPLLWASKQGWSGYLGRCNPLYHGISVKIRTADRDRIFQAASGSAKRNAKRTYMRSSAERGNVRDEKYCHPEMDGNGGQALFDHGRNGERGLGSKCGRLDSGSTLHFPVKKVRPVRLRSTDRRKTRLPR